MLKKSLLLMLLMALLAPWVANAQETLTVCDGTKTNGKIPVNGLYVDTQGTTSEFIIPANELSDIAGGTISKVTFYISTIPGTWGNPTIQLYIGEVEGTTLSGINGPSSFTIVNTSVWSNQSSTIEVEFDAPYSYGGGNLLIGTYVQTESSTYKTTYFYGVDAESGASRYNNGSGDGSAASFLPKTTLTYEMPSGDCDMPTDILVSNVVYDGATVTWEGDGSAWNLRYKASTDADFTLIEGLTSKTYTFAGNLTENTSYSVGVQTVCTGSTSSFKSTSFSTPYACPAPSDFAVAIVSGDGKKATFSWTENGEATSWQLCLNGDEENLIDMDTNPFTYTNFTPEETYTAKMRAYCDASHQSLWTNTVTFTPTDSYVLTVNDGTTTNEYVPFYGYYADSGTKGQFIIPAATLKAMQWGTISQMTFYANNSTSSTTFTNSYDVTAEFEVYIVEVTNTTFASTTLVDWSSMELVRNAAGLEIGSDKTMIVTLDAPYQYLGGNLLIGFNETTDGGYAHTYWYGIEAEGASLGGYGSSFSQRNFLPKMTFAYTPGSAPACAKPTSLAVNYTGGTEATVSWNSEATAWNIDVNGTVTAITTNPYTLTGLELDKTYEVKVQADCGGGTLSEWTNAVSFTTDMCMPEDQCQLTFILKDSYGDGWNGNAINVVDVETNVVLASMAADDHGGGSVASTDTKYLSVCDGREIKFTWVKGSYPGEASWEIYDINEELITSGTGTTDMNTGDVLATYTVDCTVTNCKKPSDLAASEIGSHSVKLDWTENGEATAWVVAYSPDGVKYNEVDASTNPFTLTGLDPETDYMVKVRPICSDFDDKWSDEIIVTTIVACPVPSALTANTTPFTAEISWLGFGENYDIQYAEIPSSKDGLWLQYDDGTAATHVGNSTVYTWIWGVMYPASMLNLNNTLSKVSFYESSYYHNTDVITIDIYTGGDTEPETFAYTEDVTCLGTVGFHEVTLGTPVSIDPTENLWIILTSNTIDRPMAMSAVDEANGRWIDNGGWMDIGSALASVSTYTFMVRGYVEGFDPSAYTWTTKTGVNTPYTITGLEPEKTYAYRVKSNCGDEGNSDWSSYCVFTTASACDTPFDLVAEPLDESATLSWAGYQESYNLKYRYSLPVAPTAPATIILEAHDVWQDNSGYQMLLDSGHSTYGTIIPESGPLTSDCEIPDGLYDNFDYKIPADADASCDAVNIVFDGAVSIEIPAGTYDWCITNPSSGGKIWIAGTGDVPGRYDDFVFEPGRTYHFTMGKYDSGDGAALTISMPMSDWVTVNDVTNPYVLTTDPSTTYDYQVQGVNGKCTGGLTDWSEIATFTTYSVVYDDEIWEPGETGYTDDVLVMHDVIIESDAIVYANSVTLDGTAQLIIEDGGQLYHNEPVEATYQKDIEAYTSKDGDGWYLIASPVDEALINDLFEGNFDLFRYDEPTAYWDAYWDAPVFNKLYRGTGYLHANAANKMVEITGEMIGTETKDFGNYALSFEGTDADLKGFNLMGNPFTRNIGSNDMVIHNTATDGTTKVTSYYGMNTDRTEFEAHYLYESPIKPGEGFFIQATAANQELVLNPSSSSKDAYNGYISIVAGNESYSDKAYIQLGYGNTLRKMSMSDNTSVCVINNGDDYASARVEELEGMMPVNFKAASTGLYTISIKANDIETGMMHLIDNFTGVDIDLMAYPSYTFQATEFDSEERFTLVFDFNTYTGVNENYAEGNFVYQSGDELYISGDGTLEVFDVMGRFVASYEVSGSKRISTSQFNTGVYVFRMVGETMMTQKIVVR